MYCLFLHFAIIVEFTCYKISNGPILSSSYAFEFVICGSKHFLKNYHFPFSYIIITIFKCVINLDPDSKPYTHVSLI